jgi:tRNA(Ile2) C34 agmatinyltransferase TiaS
MSLSKEQSADRRLKKVKTSCCKSEWEKKGRADYRCCKCRKDVTMELVLIYKAMIE